MCNLGLHSLVYTSDWTAANAHRVFGAAADLGYDLVELLMFDPNATDTALTARVSQEYSVGIVTGICGTLTADLSNPDPEIAQRGEELIGDAINAARDMGATMLGGPTFSAVHRYTRAPSEIARERVVDSYGRIADKASAAGIRVGLESLNRYESNFINTVGQAADIVRAVGSDALFVHADLFHMNIEEGDLATAISSVADVLGYVHVAESNRGPLGTGNTDWASFFAALARIDYRGPITFESFSPSVLGPDFANLVGLWRVLWSDPDQVAGDALAFLRRQLSAASLVSVS
jgi:D-psicose/D-tagatose/L-ribulose 3-epimerase